MQLREPEPEQAVLLVVVGPVVFVVVVVGVVVAVFVAAAVEFVFSATMNPNGCLFDCSD